MLSDLFRYARFAWRLVRRPQIVLLHGTQIEVDPDGDPELARLVYSERYERGEARCLLAHLEPSDRVLEVGTGIGFLATLCAQRLGSERVATYEANPELLPRIERTFALNGVRPHLTHGLLGENAGKACFFLEESFFSSSTHERSIGAREIEVPQLAVNAEIARWQPTLLIMDIEGGEAELLPLIDWSTIRKLVLELHPSVLGPNKVQGLLSLLATAGFVEDRRVSSTRKKYFARA
jgi:FkbM family methyltransferase